ncbi:hypothetical protein ACQ4WX_36390 [Streptomyces lasalocidi]|uniref:hypothetical protein n=1 Tax=Streptomyces sp. MUSC 14 TaxID=1354889 RepID=UPI001160A538|nr:hypothetical protein [Streptomyces sp. MUSC 14]
MTAATYRRISPRGGAPCWTWAAGVALLAASGRATARAGHHEAVRAAGPAMDHGGGGACSGPAMQHCSSGDVGTPRLLAPPSALAHTVQGTPAPGVRDGRSPSGVSHRAPPDLSVRSRPLVQRVSFGSGRP